MTNYFETYVHRDVRQLFPRMDLIRFQRFITMLSELSGTIINKAQVGRSLDVNQVSIRDYLDTAHQTYIWRKLPAFADSKQKSLTKLPKGLFRDSGLLHHLLGMRTQEALLRSPRVGQNFESVMIEEILKGIHCSYNGQLQYSYYRTRGGAEIDLILEGSFGTLPIEFKLSKSVRRKDLRALTEFINHYELPFGIVVNLSEEIQLISPHILQVPAGCL